MTCWSRAILGNTLIMQSKWEIKTSRNDDIFFEALIGVFEPGVFISLSFTGYFLEQKLVEDV